MTRSSLRSGVRRGAGAAVAGVLLAVGLPSVGQPSTAAGDAEFGRMWRDDGVLREGCHRYRYHYKVKPPKPEWALETFLVDPSKETIASGGFVSGNDPKKGTGKFRFCEYNTEPGRFKLRGKLTYRDGFEEWVVWVKPGFFRLREDRS